MKHMPNGAQLRPDPRSPWTVVALVAGGGLAGVIWGRRVRESRESRESLGDWTCKEQLAALLERSARQAQAARRLDHDIRAPVGAMAVALELACSTDDPVLREEAMQVLVRQVARMTTLTQRLHEISQDLAG